MSEPTSRRRRRVDDASASADLASRRARQAEDHRAPPASCRPSSPACGSITSSRRRSRGCRARRSRRSSRPSCARADGYAPKPATTVAAGEHYIIRRQARPSRPARARSRVLHEDARMRVIDKPAGLPVHATAKFYFNTLTRVICGALSRRARAADLPSPRSRDQRLPRARARSRGGRVPQGRDRRQGQDDEAVPRDRARPAAVGRPRRCSTSPLRLSTEADATRLPHVRMLPDPRGLPRDHARAASSSAPASYALVRCTLVTGRQHQIRAHLAHAGLSDRRRQALRARRRRVHRLLRRGPDARARRAVRAAAPRAARRAHHRAAPRRRRILAPRRRCPPIPRVAVPVPTHTRLPRPFAPHVRG